MMTEEIGFPEGQFRGLGVDEQTAQKLGNAFRAGNFISFTLLLETIPQPAYDSAKRLGSRLKQHSQWGKG